MPVTTPPLIPEAFAENGTRATIPDTTVAAGRASYDLGFPPITMQEKIAGGMPPDGRDMNGILYALSAHALYLQGGQPFKYDSAVSTAIGGYGVGAILESTDGMTLWMNTVNGNTTDPNASGAGWIPISSYGFTFITSLTGGTRTLTRVEARNDTIVLSGTLVANQTIVLPTDLRTWRIVNLTSGSFTTTVKTSGGTGVTSPQGGYSASVGVFGDGTNIYLSVPSVTLPIAVSPDPDTLAKRDNVGDLFARYFNSSPGAESFTVGTVVATNGSDGYLRKMTFANFLLQALSNAALTGNPTAPTQAVGNNSTRIANTAFTKSVSLGWSQAWADVTASRSLNVTYTNNTGKPIQVSVSVSINPGSNVGLWVDGVIVSQNINGSSQPESVFGAPIVPNGSTYLLQVFSGSAGIDRWSELR